LEPEDLVQCDLTGKQTGGRARLTTEIKIHLAAYEARADVCAVVHAHPPFATAFAVAGLVPSEALMPEAYLAVGKVALAPYGTPSTDELADKLRPSLRDHDAVLLANHGAMTLGRDVLAAYHRMEALEQLCRITCITRLLGRAQSLGAEEMAQLDAIRGVYGAPTGDAPCYACGRPPVRPIPRGSDEPRVHWPGNPPVWERPGRAASDEEALVRDLARRTLRSLRPE
jgi:L-fuculose-phosphate aldolase